jgi:cytoskeletal protein CcmA (bactofilin family)
MGFWDKLGNTSDDAGSEQTSQKPTDATGSQPKAANNPSKSRTPDAVRSALGKGTVIQGKLSFDTPVQIDGKLKGEVFSTDTLIVGEAGEIDADIDVRSLVVYGKVKGSVRVKEEALFAASAVVTADVTAGTISVEAGAIFNGTCAMKGTADKAQDTGKPSSKSYQLPPKENVAPEKKNLMPQGKPEGSLDTKIIQPKV